MSTAESTEDKPRRTYAQLQERAKAKAEKELREAEGRRTNGVAGVTVSTMAFSLMVGYSTRAIEAWRQGEHWSNHCAVGYAGDGTNHKVRYSLDCLHAGLTPRAAQRVATTPFGVSADRPFVGFATFESAVVVEEPWVLDEAGRVVDHALVVSDEVLDQALDDDRIRERTLVHLLLHEPWAVLAIRDGYRQAWPWPWTTPTSGPSRPFRPTGWKTASGPRPSPRVRAEGSGGIRCSSVLCGRFRPPLRLMQTADPLPPRRQPGVAAGVRHVPPLPPRHPADGPPP